MSALVPLAASAQEVAPGYVHRQWTARDGLPVDGLNDVLQTRDGYLWIATWDGLVRFDGVRFVTFHMGNTPELPSNRIANLFELPDGRLRILTALPGAAVDFRDGRFHRPFAEIPGAPPGFGPMVVEPDGGAWIGSVSGLYHFPADGSVPRRVLDGTVGSLARGAPGVLWVGLVGGGLVELREGNPRRWKVGDVRGAERVLALLPDPDGTLWIGTQAGVFRMRDGRATPVPPVSGSALPATHLARDAAGTLWVWLHGSATPWRVADGRLVAGAPSRMASWGAAGGAGMPGAEAWTVVGPSVMRAGREVLRAPSRVVRYREDREGNLWLATFNSGLYRLRRAEVHTVDLPGDAPERRAHAVVEDAAGAVWIGTPQERLFRWVDGALSRTPGAHSLFWLGTDAAGSVWFGPGVAEGAGQPDAATVAAIEAQRARGFFGMFQERGGARWFPAGGGGVSRLEHGRWTHFTELDGVPPLQVRAMHQTRDGAVWLLTHGGGLARFRNGRWERLDAEHGLASNFVRGFHEDADGILWVGSFGNGLNRVDLRGAASLAAARVTVLRTRDGLADDVVHQILEDDQGRLWIGSNRGIFAVRRADLDALAEGRIRKVYSVHYDEAHGMKSREVNGSGFPSALRSRDGRIWFPTQDGVAVIDPAALASDTTLTVLVEGLAAADSALDVDREVRLGPRQRDFEIAYTAPSFVRSAHLRFRYRLDGYQDHWVEAGTRRTAFFTNVAPGRYRFRVAVTRGDGVWTEAAAPLPIVVEPRFHETGWFRLLLLAALALGTVGAGRWRGRLLRARARELERLVAERTAELEREKELTARQAAGLAELDRAKGHFFANISHEFRTPLTLILGPLRDLAEGRHGPLPAAARAQLGMMQRNAQRLLRLINQVLDLARLESGVVALRGEPRDLVPLVRDLVRAFAPLAERRRVAVSFHAAEPLPVALDAEQMEKVVLNLLSNAFKFTEPGGRVEVRVAKQGSEAVIQVRDTGIGIAPDKLPHIFERFFQADATATRRHEGSGIGLALARELVELHGGTIAADSVPGEGSTFTVRLPLLAGAAAGRVPLGPEFRVVGVAGTAADAYPAANGTPSAAEPDLGGREPATEADRTTVLVVDDNADVRAYVRSVLQADYRVVEAADGEEGVQCAREALPDVVVADVMMPRLDGFGLVRALRADAATDCIPVILLTARAEAESEVQGLGAGADDYLTKPFHAGVLQARVAGLIASRRRLRERFREEGFPPPAPESAPAPPAREPSALEARLRALVEASLTDPHFSPEALAAAAGLSYQQLYRRLRDELDATPSHFIRTVRVERAAQLLRDGAGSVTEVAYSVGFNSLSHFNRCFRERFGAAPSHLLGTPS